MAGAIEIKALTKSYGRIQALRGIDMEIEEGEIFGFLGPNGAGKTTAIRCMLDLIRPTSGNVRVLGLDPQHSPVAVRARTGYLPGELNFDDNLTARQALRLFDQLRGGGTDWPFVDEMSDQLQLDLDRAIKNFSKGNKQKVGVVQAFMHRPECLLLDEPTSGLDPLMQQIVLRLVREAREAGATVFFSSHILSETEEVSDRLAIVRAGHIVETGDTMALTKHSFLRASITLDEGIENASLDALAGIAVVSSEDEGRRIKVRIDGDMDPLLKELAGHKVRHFETERPSLDEVFLTYYEEEHSA